MLAEIEQAEHSIFIEMYIMVDDTRGFEFIKALEKKARAGVQVKLVLDSFGSFSLSNDAIDKLRASGAEVLFFSRWLHRLHRKLLVVDEQVAITGGVNIHRDARHWADFALRMKGGRVIRTALQSFAKIYFKSGGKDSSMRRFLKHSLFAKTGASFLSYGRRMRLKRLYKEKLFTAKHSVVLVTPYFVPDRWLVEALDGAALRGVSVDIVLPQKSDSWFMDRSNHFYILKMAKTNVRFFLYPKMNHAKIFIVDEAEALIGSQNIDALSFNRNVESGVLINDNEVVADISRIVKTWENESKIFRGNEYRRRWYDYILAPIIRLLQPFL